MATVISQEVAYKDYRVKNTSIDIEYQSIDDIIEGCRRKKRESQKQLYFNYCDELFTTAIRILHDQHMAEDSLHDAFLKIFRDIKQLKSNDSLKPWMKRVVINTSLHMLQRRRRIEYTDGTALIDNVQVWDPLNGEHIEKAIMSLPEGYRIVFLLIEVEGYKHQEAAKILGISEGTSKSQLHYAKQSLKRMLNDNK